MQKYHRICANANFHLFILVPRIISSPYQVMIINKNKFVVTELTLN
jgi:hypothetical protein